MTQENHSPPTSSAFDETRVDDAEAETARPAIHEFIQRLFPEVTLFMTTLKKDGSPSVRQVSSFVEGWTIGTITRSTHLKNLHIARNPVVTYHWVSLTPNEWRAVPNVVIQGTCEIIKDPDIVEAFVRRRAEARRIAVTTSVNERWLLKTTPTMLRAEGFTGPRRPVILTTFEH